MFWFYGSNVQLIWLEAMVFRLARRTISNILHVPLIPTEHGARQLACIKTKEGLHILQAFQTTGVGRAATIFRP